MQLRSPERPNLGSSREGESEPMRIAFVLPGRGNSGGVRCTSIVSEMLRKRGHTVRIFYQRPDFSISDRLKSLRNRLLYSRSPNWLDEFHGPIEPFLNLTDIRFDKDEIIVAVGMVISSQMDTLDGIPNPRIQYLHGSTPDRPDLRDKALNLPLPKIVVASYLKDLAEQAGRGEVLSVIHNGVDCREYFPSIPECQRIGVGTIYAVHPAKDPKTVIGVLQRLSKLRPYLPLRVFGADRRPREISRHIYLRCPSPAQARDIYSSSQVWVMGSRSEGFSMPILEAMACGCAVISTDCGGPRDQIVDGENGFLVPTGDVERITNRVLLLLDNPDLLTRIQTKALETARKFTWTKCGDGLETALERVGQHLPASVC